MASFNLSLFMFIAMMVASSQLYTTTAQTIHVVGDAFGWGIPTNGVANYTTWASQQTFTVGDFLFFNYTNGQHDVAEVTAASYDPCTATNPIFLTTTGPTTLTLTTTGMHYYICTFAGHCQIGQKLTINVLPSTTATPPSMPPMTPTSPPPTTAPMPPSMTPPTTAPMPPSMTPPTTTPMPPSMAPPSPSPSITPMPPSMAPPTPSPSTTPMPPSMAPPSPSPTTTPMPPSMSPPSPPPPMTPTSTPPPMTPTSTPDEPRSGAPSLTAIVPATFLAIGLAFLNY